MTAQEIVAALIALSCAFIVARRMYLALRGKRGCGCGSGSCSNQSAPSVSRSSLARLPFVPLERITLDRSPEQAHVEPRKPVRDSQAPQPVHRST